MRFIQAPLALAAFASLATCQNVCNHKSDTSKDPSGNPLRQPALDTQVPRGQAYQIKWDPTTSGTVSIALLRGPSTNVVEYACLANSIPNSGTFNWTPSTDLQVDTTHYGLKVIVDATGEYQYSAQFGISQGSGGSSSTSTPSSSISYPPSSSATSTGYYSAKNTSSMYYGSVTSSKTKPPKTTTAAVSTSIALVTDTGSATGSNLFSTQVVGVGAGAGSDVTATATAQSPASTTPASFPKSGDASALEATSLLLGGVAAVMFLLC